MKNEKTFLSFLSFLSISQQRNRVLIVISMSIIFGSFFNVFILLMKHKDYDIEQSIQLKTGALNKPQQSDIIDLVVTCSSSNWYMLKGNLESLVFQTVKPRNTIIVLEHDDNQSKLLFRFNEHVYEGGTKGKVDRSHVDDNANSTLSQGNDLQEAYIRRYNQGPRNKKTGISPDKEIYSTTYDADINDFLTFIPKLHVFLRNGKHSMKNNMKFAERHLDQNDGVLLFVECTEYMHPSKVEILTRAYETHPELDATIEGAAVTSSLSKFEELKMRQGKFQDKTSYLYSAVLPWIATNIIKQNEKTFNREVPKSSKYTFPSHTGLGQVKFFDSSDAQLNFKSITARHEVFWRVPFPIDTNKPISIYLYRLLSHDYNIAIIPLDLATVLQ